MTSAIRRSVGDTAFLLTATEELGAMDVPGCQIGPGTFTEILVFYPHRASGISGPNLENIRGSSAQESLRDRISRLPNLPCRKVTVFYRRIQLQSCSEPFRNLSGTSFVSEPWQGSKQPGERRKVCPRKKLGEQERGEVALISTTRGSPEQMRVARRLKSRKTTLRAYIYKGQEAAPTP